MIKSLFHFFFHKNSVKIILANKFMTKNEEKPLKEIEEIKKKLIPRLLPTYVPKQIPVRLYDNSK